MGELYNPYPKLPKNIRQIGERDQIVKLYVEDYVNTYLKRLQPAGGQDLRVGLLLGTVEIHDGVSYIFIDGALEMEDVTEQGEKVSFSDEAWSKAYQNIEQMFPKRSVQGWFLCGGQGCQLSPLNYWKQHGQFFPGKDKLMYLNSGLEGEESVYITSEDGFYKLKGHSIYYERNQMMQDYMILRKDVRRVESGANDTVIRDFKQRMEDRKQEVVSRRNTIGMLGGLCSVLSIIILAGGIVMFNNFEKLHEMEGVIASVVPQGIKNKSSDPADSKALVNGSQSEVIVEEMAGEVFPTEAESQIQETVGQAAAVKPQETAQVPVLPTPEETVKESETAAKAPKETAAAVSVSETYTVGDGETLFGICFKLYGNLDKLDEICSLNGLSDVNVIISGQKLNLP